MDVVDDVVEEQLDAGYAIPALLLELQIAHPSPYPLAFFYWEKSKECCGRMDFSSLPSILPLHTFYCIFIFYNFHFYFNM